MKKTIVFLILCSVCAWTIADKNKVIYAESDDVQMNQAMAKARETYPMMLEASQKNPSARVLLKVYFFDEGKEKGGEHLWVMPTDLQGMQGTVMSNPIGLESVKANERVSFTLANISDWLFVTNGKAAGAFTVNLLRSRMSPEQRAQHDAAYPFAFE